ncbi:ABC transporter permease [Salmonirosea aquatica]|uniref:FtsX-like permease family protein n=1 Tax=Salmonirosea aquatica TaxID=2654236 RepID=A0A7C9BM37_9BACT|nr:FtsX-like permease family protein [Cytophagaceae bacterium SJW1-29]
MLRNFIKTALRNLAKNRFFTLLNVIGLALGMSVSLLFVALLVFLSRYDDFHPHTDRIHRVTTQVHDREENPHYASAPVGLAQKLRDDIAGVEKVVRIQGSLGGDAVYGEKKIPLYGYFADPEFLEVFNFPLLEGNRTTALSKPNSLVITESEATKIFGRNGAMGEIIHLEGEGDFMISGILKDVPENSHMQFGAIASYATLASHTRAASLPGEGGWKSFSNSYVYMLLSQGTDPASIQRSLDEVAEQKYGKEKNKASFKLQALDDIVPGPELYDQIGPNWGYLGLFLVGLMTLIVLVPACSNYVSLSISQSLERMKEIGVRKVMGGQKKQIILQFIVESTLIVLLALVLSYPVFELVRVDLLHQMVETSPMDLTPTLATFAGFLLFALLVGVAAGVVPAVYFSRISPIGALKGKELKTSRRSYFRKIVLATQFMLSLGFIMAVVIMMRQYQYSVSYDLGFEQQNVLDVELQNVDPQIFKNEYGKLSSVQRISASSHILGVGSAPEHFIKISHQVDSVETSSMSVDEAFIPNMGLELLAGRNFTANAPENTRLIVVNEEFAKKLELKNPWAATGRSFVLPDGREVQIAGILKNFHYSDLKEAIGPFYLEYNPGSFRYANLKMETRDVVGGLTAMERLWKKVGGQGRFTARLLSEEVRDAYSFYIVIMKLWSFLGLLAITVACLGLLGMVTFTTKRRLKEISIRKVMGATSESLVLLLSKDFVILMVVASVITIPVVYFLFNHLLGNTQHYSMEIGLLEVAVSLAIMMGLGLTTILSQTLKAANANPVENLNVSS